MQINVLLVTEQRPLMIIVSVVPRVLYLSMRLVVPVIIASVNCYTYIIGLIVFCKQNRLTAALLCVRRKAVRQKNAGYKSKTYR